MRFIQVLKLKKVFDQFSVRSGGRVVVCSNIPTIYRILNIHTTLGSVGRVQLLRPGNVIIFYSLLFPDQGWSIFQLLQNFPPRVFFFFVENKLWWWLFYFIKKLPIMQLVIYFTSKKYSNKSIFLYVKFSPWSSLYPCFRP